MQQLSLFELESCSKQETTKLLSKPHRTISVQPNGAILYLAEGGWFSLWSIAIENGHIKQENLLEYYPDEKL